MLQDILNVFVPIYKQHGDSLIFKNHKLSKGLYINLSDSGNNALLINYKTEAKDKDENYDNFVYMDYYSLVRDLNKAIDSKNKNIASNNIYSFICKAKYIQNLSSEDFSVIYDTYIDNIMQLNPLIDIEPLQEEPAARCKEIFLSNFTFIQEQISMNKTDGYIKMFVDVPEENFRQEYLRYAVTDNKLFLNSKDIINLDSNILGIPPRDFSINASKPYLLLHGTNFKIPFRVNIETAYYQIKFYDWLRCQPKEDIRLYYAKDSFLLINYEINSRGQLEITDFDNVVC